MTVVTHPGQAVARVLIVDDEPHNRSLLEVMLAPEGYELLTATNGEEALAMISSERPDIVLLDVMMPGMDGNEVAMRVKGNFATKHIPIIMITALHGREARLEGLNAGAEGFLTKPIDRAELTVGVRNLLRLKAGGDTQGEYSRILESEVTSRRAEARGERDRAQRYLDTAAVILLALDLNGNITLANKFACTVLGWAEHELIGRNWVTTCIAEAQQEHVRDRFGRLIGGNLSTSVNTIRTRGGEHRAIEWHSTTVRDDTGAVVGTFSSGTDVTERNAAVDALRAAEERTRIAMEGAAVGVWDLDYGTGAFQWSATTESHHGLAPGTFGGTLDAFQALVHPDDRAETLNAIGPATRTQGKFSVTYRVPASDGSVRWVVGAGRIVLDESGRPARAIGVAQNITDRRNLEQQLRQAQKMEAVGQLASGVAHDFNNLLTVIIGYAEIMKGDAMLPADLECDVKEIVDAAQRATVLTKQLLAFGRQQVLQAAPLDVNALVTGMTGMLARLIGENISVSLALAPELGLALADAGQVEQVVMNLVVNARDAMPTGGKVTIETANVELPNSAFHETDIVAGRYVMFAITDTGTGMDKDTQRRLFEPFFTTKEVGKGTGLGLSTTYGIVKQSNGYVWVYSELGHGTTFRVYLPCSAGSATLTPTTAHPVLSTVRGTETVLLVEDEVGVRQLAKRVLESAGYVVYAAANGEEAHRLFAANALTIDLLLTDMMMPGQSGPDVFASLNAQVSGLRVVFMSGYADQSVTHQAGIDSGRAFVQKPFTATQLLRQVRAALDA